MTTNREPDTDLSHTRRASGSVPSLVLQLAERANRWRNGLSTQLLVLTVVFVMVAEVLIFVPSIANFRVKWLAERLTAAHLASLAADAAEGGRVPPALKEDLLMSAQVQAVAIKRNEMRRMVLPAEQPPAIDAGFDLREMSHDTLMDIASHRIALIRDALYVFLAPAGRTLRVYGTPEGMMMKSPEETTYVEVVLQEDALRAAMLRHGLNILGLSILISAIAAALVYFALNRVLVRPMMRLTDNMLKFSENPEDQSRVIVPSARPDEIGVAERELAHMQTQLTQLLNQKNRLAQLGLAVSKINHDLRNMLSSAQLMSDRLASLPDPTVQRFAPKLIASLDRAISFCNATLQYGRAEEAAPRRQVFAARELVEEIGDGLGLPRERIGWVIDIDPAVQIDADRDHLYRVLDNICRNAIEVIEAHLDQHPGDGDRHIRVAAARDGLATVLTVGDDGPGVPEKARQNLFRAFSGGARKGGTGLGLAVAAELVAMHGGSLRLLDSKRGATFEVRIPDRRTVPDQAPAGLV